MTTITTVALDQDCLQNGNESGFEFYDEENPSLDRLHQLNTEVAATHGLAASAIYQYIAWHCRNFGKWNGTKTKLLDIFPYVSPKELRLVLAKLLGKEGCAKLLVRKQIGDAFNYTLTVRVRGSRLHAFDPRMAQTYGILPALIYDNIVYWITVRDSGGEDTPSAYVSTKKCHELHSYAPLRSVERAFQVLREAGELIMAGRMGKTPVWTIPLGEGKLNRWKALHRPAPVKEALEASKPVQVEPEVGLVDEDRAQIMDKSKRASLR